MLRNLKYIGAAILIWGGLIDSSYAQGNSIDQSMFYRSFVQDSEACTVSVENGVPVFASDVAGSAASTCPDAFAWVQFSKAIQGEFWEWGTDQTVWPQSPLPICTTEGQTNCCSLAEFEDPNPETAPPASCPYNRADYPGQSPLDATPNGVASGAVINHRGLTPVEVQDPGRLLRDLELEIVFRNKPMIDYIYKNDLYTKEGLAARAIAANAALNNADVSKAHSMEVRFPNDAVMVKADFLHMDVMQATGLIPAGDVVDGVPPNDPDYPYVTVYIEGADIQEASGESYDPSGYYYMLAMTNASKDLPAWHWYAMEHVSNLGRCDYIGCNDSFGYTVNPVSVAGTNFGDHFISPKTGLQNDQATLKPNDPNTTPQNPNSSIFVTGETYLPNDTGETITPGLTALFAGLGIGQSPTDADPAVLSSDDPAWKNYRLKGTQNKFTTVTGVPTGMGATITEGGFVNSASCMTCHSQASVDVQGNSGIQGVGSDWRPNLFGFSQTVMGAPDPDWFYNGGGSPNYSAIQIDFVWGILLANCVDPISATDSNCKTFYDEPKVPYGAGLVYEKEN